jgi:flagellar assembly factor FliW
MSRIEILTSRFGPIEIEPGDVIWFPVGLSGLDGCRHWVLLADAQNAGLGWLQSTTHPEVALAVVSPRRFVPAYEVRVAHSQLSPLALEPSRGAHVLVIVNKHEQSITLNLKAPLIVNLERRIGRQVVANGDQSLQYEIGREESKRKRIA